MRGEFEDQGGLFSYIDPESRIPAEHPLRRVRSLVRAVLSPSDSAADHAQVTFFDGVTLDGGG
jgi:hypothetical protein